ncbi:P-type conjugative transfer protein TrbJ [uncultured Pseudacidovorax sp.]|uniref:P-type conjugative transfer protein TrbJ n=1 Tax=uncultured Pseudacidovorax sp. TaxID=679313 RepID=UPI0025F98114|nr:P-type conjugative transfer protein TrbJ [uncultured Pseudacidovorax sp.]
MTSSRTNHRLLRRVALAAALALGAAAPAHALFGIGDIVLDPSNLAQNILTAANTLEQINNQVKQLQNEAQMLTNQAKNLARLDFNALAQLRSTLAASNRLIQEAQGLAQGVQAMEAQFQALYPQAMGGAVSQGQMVEDARRRWSLSLEALRTAAKVQAQAVQNFSADEQVLSDLVARSQSASGALQAVQATNQLLALQARQAIQAQQLQLTQDRAAALEQARQATAHERARETRRRFQGSGTVYTPYAVNFHGTP